VCDRKITLTNLIALASLASSVAAKSDLADRTGSVGPGEANRANLSTISRHFRRPGLLPNGASSRPRTTPSKSRWPCNRRSMTRWASPVRTPWRG